MTAIRCTVIFDDGKGFTISTHDMLSVIALQFQHFPKSKLQIYIDKEQLRKKREPRSN
jgi:hypothetical protein